MKSGRTRNFTGIALCCLVIGSTHVYAGAQGGFCDGYLLGVRTASITDWDTRSTVTCVEGTPSQRPSSDVGEFAEEGQLHSCETKSARLIETATMAVLLGRGNPARLEWTVVKGRNICTALDLQALIR
jgi:hypothetical protein